MKTVFEQMWLPAGIVREPKYRKGSTWRVSIMGMKLENGRWRMIFRVLGLVFRSGVVLIMRKNLKEISFLQDMQTIPNLMCLFWSGYRANHSTEKALIKVFIVRKLFYDVIKD